MSKDATWIDVEGWPLQLASYRSDSVQVNTTLLGRLGADAKLVHWIGLKHNGENFTEQYVEFDVNYSEDEGQQREKKNFSFFLRRMDHFLCYRFPRRADIVFQWLGKQLVTPNWWQMPKRRLRYVPRNNGINWD